MCTHESVKTVKELHFRKHYVSHFDTEKKVTVARHLTREKLNEVAEYEDV